VTLGGVTHRLTQETTRPLKQGSLALSSKISSFTTLWVETASYETTWGLTPQALEVTPTTGPGERGVHHTTDIICGGPTQHSLLRDPRHSPLTSGPGPSHPANTGDRGYGWIMEGQPKFPFTSRVGLQSSHPCGGWKDKVQGSWERPCSLASLPFPGSRLHLRPISSHTHPS
jgi:hypothetical protein